MKILYSAFECNPYRGSEAFCGWSWIINMRKYNEVFVITRTENKLDIEKYCDENNINDIHFFYCDINEKINLYYKYGKFFMQYYVLWQDKAYKTAKKIVKQYQIDVIHHITLGDFRVIGKMWKLSENFIFGPLGGAQYIPKKLKVYAKKYKGKELYRKAINSFKLIDFRYKKALEKTKKIFCANEETLNFITKMVKDKSKVELLTENGINQIYIHNRNYSSKNKKIKIIWLGRIVYRKGLELLIDAISYIKGDKEFEVNIYGNDQGNEVEFLKQKCKNLNIEKNVNFKGVITHEEINKVYEEADIFVFPSLRETTGTVIFEAMSHGIPIVGLKQNGLKLIATEKTALLVDIEKSSNIAKDFAKNIQFLIDNDEIRCQMSKNSIEEISKYKWEDKVQEMAKRYEQIV